MPNTIATKKHSAYHGARLNELSSGSEVRGINAISYSASRELGVQLAAPDIVFSKHHANYYKKGIFYQPISNVYIATTNLTNGYEKSRR